MESQLNLSLKNNFVQYYKPKYNFSLNYLRLRELNKVEFLSSNSKLDGTFSFKSYGNMARKELVKTYKSYPRGGWVEDGVSLFPREGLALQFSGLDSTLNRMSKWIVSVLLISMAIWRRHDGKAMWALTGSLINALLSITLKKIFKQERPVSALRSDPGMPSSHSQSIFFILVFLGFSSVEWLGINELSFTLNALILAFASYLSWLRVSQQFHTTSQVVVGATLGASFATMWHLSWNVVVGQAFYYSFWVRSAIYLGAIGFWLGFILHVIKNSSKDKL